MGHNDEHCAKLLSMKIDDGHSGWGPELWTENRTQETSGSSRWLREAGDIASWKFPANQEIIHEGIHGIFNRNIKANEEDLKQRTTFMEDLF